MLQTNSRPDQTSRVQNCPQVNLRYPKTLYQKHLLPRSMSLTLLLTPSEFFVGTFLPTLHPDMLNLSSSGQNSNTECVEPGKLKELPPPERYFQSASQKRFSGDFWILRRGNSSANVAFEKHSPHAQTAD